MNPDAPIPPAQPTRSGASAVPATGIEIAESRTNADTKGFIPRNTRRIRGLFDIYGQSAKVEWLELNQ